MSVINPEGGFALGRIWGPVREKTGEPDLNRLPFPVGSVSIKFLFTEATAAEVPLLAGAPELQAHIHANPNPNATECPAATVGPNDQPAPRAATRVRLLQVDIAVRDPSADVTTGWVFGTFVYDGRLPGVDPWDKLQPVGLMWGNDPDLTDANAAAGQRSSQGVVLSDFGLGRDFGRSGRMNGPVDNPISACLSCHMTAQWPNPAAMTPRGGSNWDIVGCWFRNIGPTMPFGREPAPGTDCGALPATARLVSLDYSLQLAVGRRNWEAVQRLSASPVPAVAMDRSSGRVMMLGQSDADTPRVEGIESLPISRAEDPTHP